MFLWLLLVLRTCLTCLLLNFAIRHCDFISFLVVFCVLRFIGFSFGLNNVIRMFGCSCFVAGQSLSIYFLVSGF